MDNKRYQVFVSSTYTDLAEPRQAVMMLLLTMDHLPAGMELFGAVDEEQFEFIKRVIDESDYYVLIVGGRYGTEAPDGKSYTEKEYDYAVSAGKKVLAFLHATPEKLEARHTEKSDEGRNKLAAFIAKVNAGRLRTTWSTSEDLAGKVAVALSKAIKLHPAVGWVRAGTAANVDTLSELNEARKEIDRLRHQLAKFGPQVSGLAGLDEDLTIVEDGTTLGIPWRGIIATALVESLSGSAESWIKGQVSLFMSGILFGNSQRGWLSDDVFQTIKIQLIAHSAIEVALEGDEMDAHVVWKVTEAGRRLMVDAGAVRSSKPTSAFRADEGTGDWSESALE
jgi:Domain of unknown function (DUF4062)